MAMSMPRIISCSVSECAYNRDNQCHTLAITVGNAGHPACDTFHKFSSKGGGPDLSGGVGACKMDICKFNKSLECSASGITVGPHSGHADCKTFSQRQ